MRSARRSPTPAGGPPATRRWPPCGTRRWTKSALAIGDQSHEKIAPAVLDDRPILGSRPAAPIECGPPGGPTTYDFQVFELLRVVERFGARLPRPSGADHRPAAYPILIGTGILASSTAPSGASCPSNWTSTSVEPGRSDPEPRVDGKHVSQMYRFASFQPVRLVSTGLNR
jgi:hypothetical protein